MHSRNASSSKERLQEIQVHESFTIIHSPPGGDTLLMLGVLLVGWVAFMQLPVSALPEVDYPTIQVVTFYPGADPEVMASSVTSPWSGSSGRYPDSAR